MINDASVVIGGGNWGIKEADVLGYKLINDEYYARDIDFANSTAAGTYTDSTGVIRKAPYNLAQYSEEFDNAAWSKTGITVTPNVEVAPNGTMTADRIQFSSSNQVLTQTTSLGTGVVCTSSFYVLGTAGQTLLMAAGGLDQLVTLTGSWQRISTTKTSINSTLNVSTFGGATARDIFLWGAQLVEGTEALPYFPTTTRLNVPRIDYRNADGSLSTVGRLLLEPQRTNSIRNSSMVGAVAGSPGTLPTTSWSAFTAGLTQTIVGTGIENGLPYIDIRFNGTASATGALIGLEAANGIAATVGQSWSESAYCKIISAPSNANSFALLVYERNSSAVYIGEGSTTIVPTSDLQRFTFSRPIAGAAAAFIQPYIRANLTNGATYDFTIRIAAPQMELGAFATTWIPTTTAAVTRNADVASRTGVSSWIGQTQGTLFAEVDLSNWEESARILAISDGSITNRIIIIIGSSKKIRTIITNGGTSQFDFNSSTLTNGVAKVAFAYANNDIAFYVNGVQVSTSSSAIIPACSGLYVGKLESSTVGQILGDKIAQAALFPTRLTNAQLLQLTTL